MHEIRGQKPGTDEGTRGGGEDGRQQTADMRNQDQGGTVEVEVQVQVQVDVEEIGGGQSTCAMFAGRSMVIVVF